MELQSLYDRLERDPDDFPLFSRIWEVLQFAPSSRHHDEEELVSLAVDAFDYLQAQGRWATASTGGRIELHWDGRELRVHEDDDRGWRYQRAFTVGAPPDD